MSEATGNGMATNSGGLDRVARVSAVHRLCSSGVPMGPTPTVAPPRMPARLIGDGTVFEVIA